MMITAIKFTIWPNHHFKFTVSSSSSLLLYYYLSLCVISCVLSVVHMSLSLRHCGLLTVRTWTGSITLFAASCSSGPRTESATVMSWTRRLVEIWSTLQQSIAAEHYLYWLLCLLKSCNVKQKICLVDFRGSAMMQIRWCGNQNHCLIPKYVS
jgi:hypothetical protein